MTNLSLAIYPSVAEFIKAFPPATTVLEGNRFLTTNQIFNICNDIIFNEDLTEKIVYDFLKINDYQLTDIGNESMVWIIKTI